MKGRNSMLTLEGRTMRFSLSETGEVESFYNKLTCHEYVHLSGDLWKIIYGKGDRTEIPVFSKNQRFSHSFIRNASGAQTLRLLYSGLHSEDGELDIELTLDITIIDDTLSVVSSLRCGEEGIEIYELAVTAASGIRSLSGDPERDSLALPVNLGQRIANPAFSDLSKLMGFRKYERRDQIHTDIDLLYPRASMQWYELYNEEEGLYVASHDEKAPTTCLHIEREVRSNILRLGIIRYPFLKKGESWISKPIVYMVHSGDWHTGARFYRSWIESSGWTAPSNPDWIRGFKGWLRVILKQHHGGVNWNYSDIPALFDEAKVAGLDTIFLLGWERGGFARLWPDYVVDEDMGGERGLREAIEYVHRKGGRVVMFLSYYLIDRESEFYRLEGGNKVTMKSCWNQEIPFSETYCGEGTWRKIANPPMPMYAACPSCPEWQEKMEKSARYITSLGADGVLFDIGGHHPYFCFDSNHPHEKPSEAVVSKADNYRALKSVIREAGSDKAILMEDNVDIYAQSMDISHSAPMHVSEDQLPEMYRYTFPEAIVTNREMGQDEEDYRDKLNFSFLYGLRFDMTIFRCCGTLSDIPRAASYLKRLNALREAHKEHLLYGRFIDNEGFSIESQNVRAKGYKALDGSTAVALWNTVSNPVSFTLKTESGKIIPCRLDGNSADVVIISAAEGAD